MKAITVNSSDLNDRWDFPYHQDRLMRDKPFKQRMAAWDDYVTSTGVPPGTVTKIITNATSPQDAADQLGDALEGKKRWAKARKEDRAAMMDVVRKLTYRHLVDAQKDIKAQQAQLNKMKKNFFASKLVDSLIGP